MMNLLLRQAATLPPDVPTVPPPSVRARPPWVLIVGGCAGLLLLTCLAAGALLAVGGFSLFRTVTEESSALQGIVDEFMTAGTRGDADAALALFASGSASRESITRLFRSRPELFDGYQSISQSNISIRTINTETIAEITGQVHYAGARESRPFSARFERQGDTWKLTAIQFADGVGL